MRILKDWSIWIILIVSVSVGYSIVTYRYQPVKGLRVGVVKGEQIEINKRPEFLPAMGIMRNAEIRFWNEDHTKVIKIVHCKHWNIETGVITGLSIFTYYEGKQTGYLYSKIGRLE